MKWINVMSHDLLKPPSFAEHPVDTVRDAIESMACENLHLSL